MTRHRPSISVVLPVHNRAVLVRAAITSAVAQFREGDELIVVDDGSTDATPAVVSGLAGPQVRSLRLDTNGGQSAARNRGLELATGELVSFLDSDDLAAPGRYDLQAARLADLPPRTLLFGGQCRFAGERPLDRGIPVEAGPLCGTLLCRRDTWQCVGPFDESLRCAEFIEWMIRARAVPLNIEYHDDVVLYRRAHAGKHVSQSQTAAYLQFLKRTLDLRRQRSVGIG